MKYVPWIYDLLPADEKQAEMSIESKPNKLNWVELNEGSWWLHNFPFLFAFYLKHRSAFCWKKNAGRVLW